MNLSHRLQAFLSKNWLLIFLIFLLVSWKLETWPQEPHLHTTYTLGSSTQPVSVLWLRQDISHYITASNGIVSAITLTRDALIAIDIKTGTTIWEAKLPFERSGVRGLLSNSNKIFTVNARRADAYEATTGKLKWSADLGYGHVSVIPQFDSGKLRVYYGEELFEIDSESGKILSKTPKDGVAWISGNITILRSLTDNRLTALDKTTGNSLWSQGHNSIIFDTDEGREPQDIEKDVLVVGYTDKRICALNLQTGEYKWCRPEVYISKVAVDNQLELGYAMRSDFVLVTMDLQTGDILEETRFLSSEPDKKYSGFIPIVFSDGIVVISFYDSGQTFGLSFAQ